MVVGVMTVKLRAPWVHSLKEKRMTLRSIKDRVKNKYNVSIAEVEDMDLHQSIVLGVSCVSTNKAHANSMLDDVLNFIETNFDTEMLDYQIELV